MSPAARGPDREASRGGQAVPFTLEGLARLRLAWPFPFIHPAWMKAWRDTFAPDARLWVRLFGTEAQPAGAVALRLEEETGRFVGDAAVCDHLDLYAGTPGRDALCAELLAALRREGVRRLDLGPLRPESIALTELAPAARRSGAAVAVEPDGLLFEFRLPDTWEGYLRRLSTTERHEVRRKLRRLAEAGPYAFRLETDLGAQPAVMDLFFTLFRANRPDKAAFLDAAMESFFRRLAESVPGFAVGFLDLGGLPAAAVLCCDFGGTRYLYNSAYRGSWGRLGVGILCKLLSIRDAIDRGLHAYSFLRGAEDYKRRLGGAPVALHRLRIALDGGEAGREGAP